MRRTVVTTFLFLLLAPDIFSAVSTSGNNILFIRQVPAAADEILATSDQQSLCGGSIGLTFLQFFEPQFAFEGRAAFFLLYDESFSSLKLFSFSVKQERNVDFFDLTQEFSLKHSSGGLLPIDMKVHRSTGLIAVLGLSPEGAQKVLLLGTDSEGHLHRLWAVNFAANTLFFGNDLAFDRDGSRIYLIHSGPAQSALQSLKANEGTIIQQTRSRTFVVRHPSLNAQPPALLVNLEPLSHEPVILHFSLLSTEDGATVTTVDLPVDSVPGLIFNEARGQVIVLEGKKVRVFAPKEDILEIESTFTVNDELGLSGQGFSPDGRYLIAYGGYVPTSARRGKNFYYSFDLIRKTVHELALEQSLFPINNAMTFHQPTRTLYVPLSSRIVVRDSCLRLNIYLGGNRQIDVITLNQDGSLSRSLTFEIPERGSDESRAKGIGPEAHRIAISATGALGFISLGSTAFSLRGYILSFDTLTGEIVGERAVDGSFSSIHLFEQMGLFVSTDATENLPVIKANTRPVVEEVVVKQNRTIIKGFNFLSGARVQINDEDIGLADRSRRNPGRALTINRGKRDFARGQEFSVVITNRDGLKSEPFTFSR